MFTDRHDAGKRLAKQLEAYRGTDAVVLALPRGGVVLGYEVARALALPLDIVIVRKIGAPGNPEFAIGAVDERGLRLMNEESRMYADPAWLAEEAKRQQDEAKRRVLLYRSGKKAMSLKGKIVILVDDGIATGLTMRLAAKVVREQKPLKIIVAIPVAPLDSLEALRADVTDIVLFEAPEDFLGAVGAHYIGFDQVEDAEVIRLLTEARRY